MPLTRVVWISLTYPAFEGLQTHLCAYCPLAASYTSLAAPIHFGVIALLEL